MNQKEKLLREYVECLVELKLNKWFINRLGIHNKTRVGVPVSITNIEARIIAIEWIDDIEYELGHELGKEVEAQVKRFTANHWHEIKKHAKSTEEAKLKIRSLLDSEFNHLYLKEHSVLHSFIKESFNDVQFIQHLENGLGYSKNRTHEASQIASDWLEEAELRMDNLLSPGHVFRIEKFINDQWPIILEQYRGNKNMALIALNNLLDANFNDLR